jgi:pilus assembly protein CpaB
MNNKALLLSIVAALTALFFVQSYVESEKDAIKAKYGTEVNVLKAKRDIKEGETILETMLSLEKVPKSFLEPASIHSLSEKPNDEESRVMIKSLVGTVALVPIRKDEQITRNKLTEPSIRTGLAPQIAPGRRAVTIPVNEFTGVGKLVKPGDRVDLIAVLEMGSGKENKIAKTLLQDIVVLAVGRNVTNNIPRIVEADPSNGKEKVKSLTEDFSFNSVTVEVEPAQAQALALVMANGDSALTLSLRNNDDADRSQSGAITLIDVLGADATRVQRNPSGAKK